MKKCEYIPFFVGGERSYRETTMVLMPLFRYYHLCVARQKLIRTLDAILQKRFDSETFIFIGRRGQGMSLYLAHSLLREVMRNPGQRVYVNFELPKWATESIGRYADIKKVDVRSPTVPGKNRRGSSLPSQAIAGT